MLFFSCFCWWIFDLLLPFSHCVWHFYEHRHDPWDLATVQTGGRPWHFPHNAGFPDTYDSRVEELQRLQIRFQRTAWETTRGALRGECVKLNKSKGAVGSPGSWRCQKYIRSAEESYRLWSEPAQERGHVGWNQKNHDGGAAKVSGIHISIPARCGPTGFWGVSYSELNPGSSCQAAATLLSYTPGLYLQDTLFALLYFSFVLVQFFFISLFFFTGM